MLPLMVLLHANSWFKSYLMEPMYLYVPILLCFPIISLTVFGTSVTNLNEPPRALAAYTLA